VRRFFFPASTLEAIKFPSLFSAAASAGPFPSLLHPLPPSILSFPLLRCCFPPHYSAGVIYSFLFSLRTGRDVRQQRTPLISLSPICGHPRIRTTFLRIAELFFGRVFLLPGGNRGFPPLCMPPPSSSREKSLLVLACSL